MECVMVYNWFRSIITMEVILVSISGQNLGRIDSKAEDDSKIVGGFDISLDKAPFLASLQKPLIGHFCGASLLSLVSVLTGCHCLAVLNQGVKKGEVKLREWTDITVHVGSEDIDEPSKLSQRRNAREVVIHPNCSFEKYLIYDYGVLFVNEPFKISPTVHPFELVSLKKLPFDLQTADLINSKESECFVAGWGATEADRNRHSFAAKAVRMMIISDTDCADKLGRENVKFKDFHFADHAQMCSLSYGYRKNSSDCIGDSGGPFFCGKKVFAIVSYGYDCGFWDTPNVYAKLSHFVEWYATIKYKENEATPRCRAETTTQTHLIRNSSTKTLILRSFLYVIIQIYIF